ncbi:MAG: acyl-CoA thioesterase [Chloroflexota bacterium]|nr:MAG: acyl-CoA thioesterase [Chloroflexota bacterium]
MGDDRARADPLEFTLRWPVRGYELDSNGHVNNAVYLSWAEELATAHAEAAGYGRDWSVSRGGGWVVRRTEITYHRPAVYGDEVELTVRVDRVGLGSAERWPAGSGAAGTGRTRGRRYRDDAGAATALTCAAS